MATGGVLGNGSKIGYGASSPVSFTGVGQVMNLDKFPELIADDVDTTRYSTSKLMTSMPGMIPAPEVEFTLLLDVDPATSPTHEALRQYQAGSGHANAGVDLYWRIEVPSNRAQSAFRAVEFRGYVKAFSWSAPIAGAQQAKVVIKFAGDYWVPAAVGSSLIS